MKLYLNKKLEEIPVYRDLLILINEMYKSGKLDSSDMSKIESRHLYDPVRDFIDFFSKSSNLNLDEGRIDYIVNSFYSSKGSPKIFDMFDELFDVRVKYNYRFPVIEIMEFGKLKLSDVILFINKFINMIYYLIYYTEININIKKLVLSLQGNLIQYNSGKVIGYDIYKITDVNYGITG